MKTYLDLLAEIRNNGVDRMDRTGVGTRSLFVRQMRFDLQAGFPLLTTKKVHFKSIVHELLWMLRGETNVRPLQENGVKIWNEWADEDGELGPVYGYQWRTWPAGTQTIDQIKNVINALNSDPYSRRIIVSAWNVTDLPLMSIPPCPVFFQFYVADGKLSCHLTQRSGDMFLGVPFDIASYSLLTLMIAQVTGLELGEFIHTISDAHIYANHFDQVDKQLQRTPRELPAVCLTPDITDIDAFQYEHVELQTYNPWPAIRAPIAV